MNKQTPPPEFHLSPTEEPTKNTSTVLPRVPAAGQFTRFAAIFVTVGTLGGAFAYTAGWLTPERLTPERIVDALGQRGGDPTGHRRNHSKGICFTGEFQSNGSGARLSTASPLRQGMFPVVGRFAIAVGNPMASDVAGRVRSMALRITAPDGEEWRSGMNNSPVFVVSTPKAFYEATVAAKVDPATGKADPKAAEAFLANHPESSAFNRWAHSAPWTSSFVDQEYNSLTAFVFEGPDGNRHPVRWSMEPTESPSPSSPAELAALGPDFLDRDLRRRLDSGELRWRMVVTLAAPGDATDDATRAWPSDRERVDVGTLVVRAVQDEADGPCRDVNYDPEILPSGIAPSDDPLLPARSSAYANSFDRRIAEVSDGARLSTSSGVRK